MVDRVCFRMFHLRCDASRPIALCVGSLCCNDMRSGAVYCFLLCCVASPWAAGGVAFLINAAVAFVGKKRLHLCNVRRRGDEACPAGSNGVVGGSRGVTSGRGRAGAGSKVCGLGRREVVGEILPLLL